MARLSQEMKKGFSAMATARFSNPVGITRLQYDLNMVSNRFVQHDGEKLKLESGALQTVETSDDDNDDGEPRRKALDPVQWFGYLPSQPMRDAQKHFQKSLELAIEATDALINASSESEK